MRQGTNNRRSRGRGGSGGGAGSSGGGGGGRKQPAGRFQSFDSNGPSGRLRGNASQLYEKYQTLGRDTTASDRIIAENLLQHAEHYFRVMNAAGAAAAAASGEAEPRPRINGGDGQPIVEPVAAPAPAVAPDSRRDDSPPMITAASPRAENENAAAEAVEDVAAPPVPDTPIDDPAPKKATAKPRRRTKNIDTAAKTAKENAVEPADDDQELAS